MNLATVIALVIVMAQTAPALAADDETFASLQSRDGGHTYEVVYTNATDRDRTRPLPLGAVRRPAFSPNGKRIAFSAPVTDGTDGRWGIYRAAVDGTNLTRLTAPSGADLDPAWSHDGRWIAFSRDNVGSLRESNCCVIRYMRANGKQKAKVPGTEGGINPSWSPNGKRIVYEKNGGLWVTNLSGTNTFQLAVNGHEPAWAPDGSKIAYVRSLGGDHQLVVIPADGGAPNVRATSGNRLEAPTWDGDGTSLYYLRYSGRGYDGRSAAAVWWDRAGDKPAALYSDDPPLIHLTRAGQRSVACDFDGDFNGDLAVGAPRDDEAGQPDAGAVNVIFGNIDDGLSTAGDELWHQAVSGLSGSAGPGDRFGKSVACGDFDNDGFGDLAVGAPGDFQDAGVVNVLFGSPGGLSTAGDQLVHQDIDGIPGSAGPGDAFGAELAVGDFDGDGYDDLAIGAPGDLQGAGVVNVMYGSRNGLSAVGTQLWHQDVTGIKGDSEPGDDFGAALAAGDFDRDGKDDLAIGAPGEDGKRGAVNVLYGRSSGLAQNGDQLWKRSTPGVKGNDKKGDRYGRALAAGDLDGDGFDDLAIGAPGADDGAGIVGVLYGTKGKLSADGDQVWRQDTAGVPGASEPGDAFGRAVAIGDFDADRRADLVIGVPGEDLNTGRITVLYGTGSGLSANGAQRFLQGTDGVKGAANRGDRFGLFLAAGDFDGDRRFDIAVGAPGENYQGVSDAGAVNVLYGSDAGITSSGDQIWRQDTQGIAGSGGVNDGFGGL